MAIQASFPIWQDERLLHNYDRLDYYVTFNDETIFRGRAFRSPKNVPIELDINRIVGDWLENGIDPEYEGVLKQENAWGQFKVWDQTTGYLLAEYGVMFNWEQEWSGESKVLSEPVNGRMDPRMRLFWSKYNVSETSVVVEGEDIYWFDADDAVSVAWDAGRATVGIRTNYSIREIVAVCPEGVRTLVYGANWQFEVPVNDDPDNPKTYTVQWYRNGVLLDQTVITVAKAVYVFNCDETATAPAGGGNVTIHYQTNIPDNKLTAVVPSGWTIVSMGNGVLVVSVPPNSTGSLRTETVSFYLEGAEFLGSTTVSQSAATGDWFWATPAVRKSYAGGTAFIAIDTSYDIYDITIGQPSGTTVSNISQTGYYLTLPANTGRTDVTYTINYRRNGVLLGTTVATVEAMEEYVEGDYFTIEITELSESFNDYLFQVQNYSGTTRMTFDYSLNGGPWNTVNVSSGSNTSKKEFSGATVGDIYRFRSNGGIPLRSGWSGSTYPSSEQIPVFSMRFGSFKMYGNILSLVYGDNYEGQTTFPAGQFYGFFGNNNPTKIDVSDLVLTAKYVPDHGYKAMFFYCREITVPPTILAESVGNSGCRYMFYGNQYLTTAPELNATQIGEYAYESMFFQCSGLTTAMETLPAELAPDCYENMFLGCRNLENTPDILGTTIQKYCFMNMFNGCTKVNRFKALATSVAETAGNDYAFYMLEGTAQTGSFIKPASATFWTTGYNGIPANWTVIEI